jgi:prevent-host-death family protein
MKEYGTTEFRRNLSDLFDQVYFHKERVIITRKNGKERIALIPMEDFELLGKRKADSGGKERTKTPMSKKEYKYKRVPAPKKR